MFRAAARSAGVRVMEQRAVKLWIIWNVSSCSCAMPPGPAGAGCQSKNGVAVTAWSLAGSRTGVSGALAGEAPLLQPMVPPSLKRRENAGK